MSPRSPDLPNPASWPARLAVAAWPAGRSAPHRARAALTVAAGVLALVLLAAWIVPPLLDWGRFRTGIAAIAAAQLGRRVVLGGEVTLRLLPEAVLTASDVTLPDQGDGVSAQIGALRLQVAVLPLLAGHIVPRDLALATPVLRLPWPLPETLAHPDRPRMPHAFAAHVDNGTLHVGEARVTGINAGIHGGPEPASGIAATGLVAPEPATLGFGAEGFATFGGRSWRFTTALGVPDADGVSAVDLAVTGQGVAGQTRGTIQGTLAEGVVQGRLVAGGPDLSQLLPAAALAWHAEAPFVADGGRIEARAISVSLGGAPADASLLLRLKNPARLDGRVHAASLDLDGWVRVLRSWRPGTPARRLPLPAMPGRVEWSADSARFLGGMLQGLHGALVSDGSALALQQVETGLPGAAHLSLSGRISVGPDGPHLAGPARLDAPAFHETLAWLRPLAPSLADAVPHAALNRASLSGTVTLGTTSLSATGVAGQIDGAAVAGGFDIVFGDQPRLGVDVSLDRLSLDDWLAAGPAGEAIGGGATLAGIGQRATRLAGDLHVRAAAATWRGLGLRDATLDLRTGPAGFSVDHAAASLPGAWFTMSGAVAPDGRVSGGTLSASATDLAALPSSWHLVPGLWLGTGSLETAVSGPPNALDIALRVEAGDLLFEAEGRGDLLGATATGTVTLRHPGAPRLLAALGVAGAEAWLGTGSVAVRAQVAARPGQIAAEDVDLNAADLRMSGALTLDLAGAAPFLRGHVAADEFFLPPLPEAGVNLSWMRGWAGQVSLAATRLTIGGRAVGEDVSAELGFGGGNGLMETSGTVAGGHLAGQMAIDASGGTPRIAVLGSGSGLRLDALPGGLPVGLAGGEADATFDGSAEGDGEAALRRSLDGTAHVILRDARLTGLDMAKAGQAEMLGGNHGRQALAAALSEGATDDLSGTIDFAVAQGHLSLAPATLASPSGALSVSGKADLVAGNVNLALGAAPAGTGVPGVGVAVAGPWGAAHVTPALGPAAPKGHARQPAHRAAPTPTLPTRGRH